MLNIIDAINIVYVMIQDYCLTLVTLRYVSIETCHVFISISNTHILFIKFCIYKSYSYHRWRKGTFYFVNIQMIVFCLWTISFYHSQAVVSCENILNFKENVFAW